MSDRKEWVILVAQFVEGKSKFPHGKVGKFQRYKPWPYRNSSDPHRIIYARYFLGTEEDAQIKAKQVDQEMFNTYVLGMANTKVVCVSEYTVVLHNITNNIPCQMSSTVNDSSAKNEGYLFEDELCNNKNLSHWGIVKGLL